MPLSGRGSCTNCANNGDYLIQVSLSMSLEVGEKSQRKVGKLKVEFFKLKGTWENF